MYRFTSEMKSFLSDGWNIDWPEFFFLRVRWSTNREKLVQAGTNVIDSLRNLLNVGKTIS